MHASMHTCIHCTASSHMRLSSAAGYGTLAGHHVSHASAHDWFMLRPVSSCQATTPNLRRRPENTTPSGKSPSWTSRKRILLQCSLPTDVLNKSINDSSNLPFPLKIARRRRRRRRRRRSRECISDMSDQNRHEVAPKNLEVGKNMYVLHAC